MKVLIIQPWLSYRGAESISIDEAHGLRSFGHSVSILCLFVDREHLRKKDLTLSFILPSPFIARFSQRSHVFFFIFGFFILVTMAFINGKKFDIYNPHNFPSSWVAVVAAWLYKKPVFWTVHNFPQHGFTNSWVSRIWEGLTSQIDQLFVQKIAGIICVSEKVRKQVYRRFKRYGMVVNPPVDANFFSAGNKRALTTYHLPVQRKVVLIPSKLHERKNLYLALQAIKHVVRKEQNVLFVFAGEGSIASELQDRVEELEVAKFVRFVGFLPKDMLRNFYKASRFVFLPGSFGEGFNVVVLEALCAGTPSLVIEGSGVDAWVKSNGVGVVSRPDPKEIARSISFFLGENNIKSELSKKRKSLIRHLSPESYAKHLVREFLQES